MEVWIPINSISFFCLASRIVFTEHIHVTWSFHVFYSFYGEKVTFLYRPLTEKVNVELLNDFFDTFHIVNDCNKNGNFITERVEPTEERKKKLKEEIESLVKYNDLLISFNMETYNEYTVFFFPSSFCCRRRNDEKNARECRWLEQNYFTSKTFWWIKFKKRRENYLIDKIDWQIELNSRLPSFI